MMLPEHVAELLEWKAKKYYIERPELDEFDYENIEETLEVAHRRQCIAHIQTWKDGKLNPYRGKILEINVQTKIVMLEDPFCIERIEVGDIVSVQCIN